MRSPEDIHADLEADRGAREAEMAIFERLALSAEEGEKGSLRRSLILLIYAHLEGFCKFSLFAYVQWLNSSRLKCSDVSYPLVAATLSKVFASLRDPNSKHNLFRHVSPDDPSLHLVAREQVFIEKLGDVVAAEIAIPDKVIDTKSNVTPEILMKMLFLLGMRYQQVQEYSGGLNKLLGIRNSIAHGDRLAVPSEDAVREYKMTAKAIMDLLQEEVYSALLNKSYRRAG